MERGGGLWEPDVRRRADDAGDPLDAEAWRRECDPVVPRTCGLSECCPEWLCEGRGCVVVQVTALGRLAVASCAGAGLGRSSSSSSSGPGLGEVEVEGVRERSSNGDELREDEKRAPAEADVDRLIPAWPRARARDELSLLPTSR